MLRVLRPTEPSTAAHARNRRPGYSVPSCVQPSHAAQDRQGCRGRMSSTGSIGWTRPGCLRGGEGEIRTPEGLTPLPVFKTGAFNRSATSPFQSNQPLFEFYQAAEAVSEPVVSTWQERRSHRAVPSESRARM